MDQIKRFITCQVPVFKCNFKCCYCYLSHHKNNETKGIVPFAMKPEHIAQFFSKKRVGGIAYFNLCAAGETMMHPQLLDLVQCLLKEGHYVDIITNGTLTQKFKMIIDNYSVEEKKRLFIKFSFHYLQLKERNLMQVFINNVNRIKNDGISYTVEITPHDELVPYIDEIKTFSLQEFGALPHITVARDESTRKMVVLSKYNIDEYKRIWSVFDSTLFDFKASTFNKPRKEFCYAGDWSLVVNLETGNYYQCYLGDCLGNITQANEEINFKAVGKCPEAHCFNGHAFLALGNIPELDAPTYAEERNRVCIDGKCWLQPEVNDFFSSKLYNGNEMYANKKKRKYRYNNLIKIIKKMMCI